MDLTKHDIEVGCGPNFFISIKYECSLHTAYFMAREVFPQAGNATTHSAEP